MTLRSLSDRLSAKAGTHVPPHDWKAKPLPLIASKGIKEVCLNFETTGFKWFDGDRPISASIDYPTADGFVSEYHSWGHAAGNTTDAATFRAWANVELRGVTITNINTRFDVHHGREFGIDFEALGCPLGDVGHYAALLDDHRQRFGLDALATDYFGGLEVPRLDESHMAQYPAWLAAPRSMYNVQLVRRLKQVMWPELTAQNLHRVRAMEDKLIYVVCEMEKNGSPLDLNLLAKWDVETKQLIDRIQQQIAALTGRHIRVDLFGGESGHLNPDSPKEMEDLFNSLGLPIARTGSGRPSFSSEVLKHIDHPVIALVRQLNRLIDLRAKYIVHHRERVGADGIMRYALHQLRAKKDETESDRAAGTVTGRFSSTEIVRGVGTNIQQEIKLAKQRVAWGYADDDPSHDDEIFPIRRLHIPDRKVCPDAEWLSSDAMQIEYRLFANEVNSPRINAAFENDPKASFHKLIHGFVKEYLPDLPYRRMKDVNFAKIYGARQKKIALMLGYITPQQYGMLVESKAKNDHPLLAEVNKILEIYSRELPEADAAIGRASALAKSRGYICSIMGRRQRFPDRDRLHKALNSRIQPSAADIMKTKLLELHDARKYTNFLLRFTVHDEVNGDARDGNTKARVAEVLDSQSFTFKIPILWDTGTGPNWAECG